MAYSQVQLHVKAEELDDVSLSPATHHPGDDYSCPVPQDEILPDEDGTLLDSMVYDRDNSEGEVAHELQQSRRIAHRVRGHALFLFRRNQPESRQSVQNSTRTMKKSRLPRLSSS